MKPTNKKTELSALIRRAVLESFVKLDPRILYKNPVMFVVEIGALVTTIDLLGGIVVGAPGFSFSLQITLWLWFTVLFANFAEAMAEGRGKAQAETLRKARSETVAYRLTNDGKAEQVPGSRLRAGELVLVTAGEFVPSDGEIVEGV